MKWCFAMTEGDYSYFTGQWMTLIFPGTTDKFCARKLSHEVLKPKQNINMA